MNILISSVGTRNQIINCFKKAIDGNVVAMDMSGVSSALYDADRHYIIPAIHDPAYLPAVFDICKKEKIDAILSLIDPELEVIAENADKFAQIGVKVIGSSYELCKLALNKMEMYHWLSKYNYNCAKSYDSKSDFIKALQEKEISFPAFVKPISGSASIAINKAENMNDIDYLFEKTGDLMIQEFLDGQEIGADVYIDMISGEVVSIFTKKKLLMRAGETDKAISFKDEKLFGLIEKFCVECGWRGQIDIDIFEIGGEYYINEVNPRFGGGYPLAYECGCNSMELIVNNIKGIANKKNIGNYPENVYMMKYSEIKTIKKDDIG